RRVYRLMFAEKFASSFPPNRYALDAYLALIAEEAGDVPWMVAGVAADVLPLLPDVAARGGHLRVGLEDAPLGSQVTNLQWVERAVSMLRESNVEPASGAEVRAQLASLPAA